MFQNRGAGSRQAVMVGSSRVYKDLVFVTSDNKLMALIRGLKRLMGGEVKSQVNEERLWLRTQSDCSITGEGVKKLFFIRRIFR